MLASMPFSGAEDRFRDGAWDGAWDGPMKPSSEWRFHRDLLQARAEFGAVVHTHAPFSTILAIARKPIPAVHYMMAAFGGPDIRCSGYAEFGTPELSALMLKALKDRSACLLGNHGQIAFGQQHQEFLAAVTGDAVVAAQVAAQQLRYLQPKSLAGFQTVPLDLVPRQMPQ